MKFHFLLSLLALVVCTNAAPRSRYSNLVPLNIYSPPVGTTMAAGSSVLFTWTVPIKMIIGCRVNLLKGPTSPYTLVTTLHANFHYPYTTATIDIPQNITAGTDYMISIKPTRGITNYYGPLGVSAYVPTQIPSPPLI
ncbi:hypothetical protein CLU79DRAFT_749970 [Phycomyces nitens]|nr:hypothetical protein CLU79DRAFT_749970 [Phycomyces nitens]